MTQHDQIIYYCLTGQRLSPAKALTDLGIYALSQRWGEISRNAELCKQYEFHDEWITAENGKRFKEYWLTPKFELTP